MERSSVLEKEAAKAVFLKKLKQYERDQDDSWLLELTGITWRKTGTDREGGIT